MEPNQKPDLTYKLLEVKGVRYSKRCKTCMYMKSHSTFRRRIYNSTYYYPDSHENVQDICEDYADGPTFQMVYRHLRDHKYAEPVLRKKKAAERLIAKKDKQEVEGLIQQSLEGEVVDAISKPAHVKALDDYITQAEELVKEGKIKITASSFLQAISIRENMDKNKKDRSTDLIKTLAGLAAPNK